MESYLNSGLSKPYTKSIAAFRLSAHKLEVEIGRYCKPKPTPPEERICRQCSLAEIEDERHFLFKCEKYSDLRHTFLKRIEMAGYKGPTDGEEGMFHLFTCEIPGVLFGLGEFIYKGMKERV